MRHNMLRSMGACGLCGLILIVAALLNAQSPPLIDSHDRETECGSTTVIRRANSQRLTPAAAGSFSIVVIPDTQRYTKQQDTPGGKARVVNTVFENHTRWIVDNILTQRIVFVSHVGDVVDENSSKQWEVARRCMDRLHGRIPYGISVGNHDMKESGDASLFQRYFPQSRFQGFKWYGGCFDPDRRKKKVSGNNVNSFQLFSAEGLDFVALHLECNAPDDVLRWANAVLTLHAARRAIVTTHMGLGPIDKPKKERDYFSAPKGRMRWSKIHGKKGNTPQQMWTKCFSKHKNVFMICCGDQSRTTAMTRFSRGAHGNLVFELLSDYTSSGPLRIYRFEPSLNRIRVITFDTTRRSLCEHHKNAPQREQHQFILKYPMSQN